MQLKVYKALWGDAEFAATEADFERIKSAGYDGIEFQAPKTDPATWQSWLKTQGLDYVGMVFPATKEAIADAVKEQAAFGPQKITMHSGRDKMTFDEGCAFLEEALRVEESVGIPIAHETHRHRLFFTPWNTAQYLEKFPELKLCTDFSHWCCVCESMLRDMEDWVTMACKRSIHIHGRVGWEESAQVSDPRAPEYADRVERHEEWWDRIWEAHHERDEKEITFTPEYGPPGYMATLPFTRQPVASLWDVCLWGAERIRERWER
jgi:hypothetical protein